MEIIFAKVYFICDDLLISICYVMSIGQEFKMSLSGHWATCAGKYNI